MTAQCMFTNMPIIAITTKATRRGPGGSRGILAEIARRLNVSRAHIAQVNKQPRRSERIAAILLEYQRTGRLPQPVNQEEK